MAEVTPRFCWDNLIHLSNTVITASSSESNFSVIRLRDPLRSKVWKTKLGWTIDAELNDKIDITEATTGDATATLTAGNYATGALMAAEVQTRLNVAATDNSWTCTYSTSTNKFTIAHDNVVAGGIEWSTGASTFIAGIDLGFDVSSDDTGASSYVANEASYQSRHWAKFDLQAAMGVSSVVIINHNSATADGIYTAQGNATDAWTSPTKDITVTGDDKIRVIYTTEASLRWWRIVIDDVQNIDGYNTAGMIYIGTYTQPTRSYAQGFTETRHDLSSSSLADGGAHYSSKRQARLGFECDFLRLANSDKTALDSMADYVSQGRNFFFGIDPQNTATNTLYGFLDAPLFPTQAGGGDAIRWNYHIVFLEALG